MTKTLPRCVAVLLTVMSALLLAQEAFARHVDATALVKQSQNYNLEHPAGTAGGQLRFIVTLLHPR